MHEKTCVIPIFKRRFSWQWQWRSQYVEKVTHIKGRLLKQAVIFFSCVPFFKMGTSLFAPKGNEFFPLRAVLRYGKSLTTFGDLP